VTVATAFDTRAARLQRLADARLYLVCDSAPAGRGLSEVLPAAIAGGVDVVQLRDKYLGDGRHDRELLMHAREARDLCHAHGALLIINDRPEVAREADADGVHVGQEDMPVSQARELVGEELLIGLSTHAPAEIDATATVTASADRPDYIGVGPVHATPTKEGRPAVGLELVRYAADRARAPFFAIGGIDAKNIDEVLDAGATRVCVLRAIAHAEDPERAARELRGAIDGRLAGRGPLEAR
jgi:thiamine-phosphate pyrophosphorylase